MTIPDTVHIGGLPYIVTRVPPSTLGEQREGFISYREQRITLVDADTDYAKITFLHECLHGMLEALGLTEANQDERLVDGLAHQLYQLLEDNPQLLAQGAEDPEPDDTEGGAS